MDRREGQLEEQPTRYRQRNLVRTVRSNDLRADR
jgi:hypothetical protein